MVLPQTCWQLQEWRGIISGLSLHVMVCHWPDGSFDFSLAAIQSRALVGNGDWGQGTGDPKDRNEKQDQG